jgi:hypothetical protein
MNKGVWIGVTTPATACPRLARRALVSTDSLGEDLRVGDPGSHSAVLSEPVGEQSMKVFDVE